MEPSAPEPWSQVSAPDAAMGSIASAAVEVARKLFGDLRTREALVIGGGLAAEPSRALMKEGIGAVVHADPDPARGLEVATRLGGTWSPLEELDRLLIRVDLILTCGRAATARFTRASVASLMKVRRHRPLLLIDLATPQDVAPEVAELSGVFAYDHGDLLRLLSSTSASPSAERALGGLTHQLVRGLRACVPSRWSSTSAPRR